MSKDKTKKRVIGFILLAWGIGLILEGLKITSLGKPAADTPYWIVTVAGIAILLVGVLAMMVNLADRWNDLLAFFITALMGTIGGWISFFSSESSIGGNVAFLSPLLGIPVGRIFFGVGSLICFMISFYALKLFLEKPQAQRQ
jgi:hypothetical protein